MNKQHDILEDKHFRDTGFSVPEGYFDDFPERMIERIRLEQPLRVKHKQLGFYRPWMTWVSGVAAILVIGWIGFRVLIQRPSEEALFQDRLEFLVEYSGNELNEALLAGYIEEKGIVLTNQDNTEIDNFIRNNPDQAEELIYESIIY